MKNQNRSYVIIGVISLLLILFVIYINRSVIAVRIFELSQKLEQINRNEKGINYMDVLFKFEVNRKLYLGKITEDEVDVEELKVINVLSYQTPVDEKLQKDAAKALPVINLLRFFMGKSGIKFSSKENQSNFDLAYFYERNGYFKKAIEVYNTLIVNSSVEKPVVLLHKGYCQALSGNDKGAEENLTEIIEKYSDNEVSVAAATLLMYIRDFRGEADKINREKNPTLENSIKLLRLTSFDKAFDMLKQIEGKDNETTVKYYKARYYEETGEKDKAVELYQDIIVSDTQSEYAKKANRRIFIVSESVKDGQDIAKLSSENNKFLGDELYVRMEYLSDRLSKDENGNDKKQMNMKYYDGSGLSEEKVEELIKQSIELGASEQKRKEEITEKKDYTKSYYNKSGAISKIEMFSKEDVLTGYYLYIYDRKGNRIRIDAYDAKGKKLEYY